MNISTLEKSLDKYIISAHTPIPECAIEEGIRFLIPVPSQCNHGALFVGTPLQWKKIMQTKKIQDGCTYFICSENESDFDNLTVSKQCNVFFLRTGYQTVLQKISSLSHSEWSDAESDFHEEYVSFWKDVMDDKFSDYAQINAVMKEFPYEVHEYVACIIVRHESYVPSNFSVSTVHKELVKMFPDTNLFYTNNEWIIIYSQHEVATDTLKISYPGFSKLLEQYNLNAGISYASHWANLLHTLYLTAAAAIDLGTTLSVVPTYKRIYTYYQYNPYYVIHMSYRKFTELYNTSIIYLTHPDVFYLWNSDKDLFEILYAYLFHGCSISETSQALFMHRNTICNKLKKIEAVLSHDINDPQYQLMLLLSCMLIKYHSEYI